MTATLNTGQDLAARARHTAHECSGATPKGPGRAALRRQEKGHGAVPKGPGRAALRRQRRDNATVNVVPETTPTVVCRLWTSTTDVKTKPAHTGPQAGHTPCPALGTPQELATTEGHPGPASVSTAPTTPPRASRQPQHPKPSAEHTPCPALVPISELKAAERLPHPSPVRAEPLTLPLPHIPPGHPESQAEHTPCPAPVKVPELETPAGQSIPFFNRTTPVGYNRGAPPSSEPRPKVPENPNFFINEHYSTSRNRQLGHMHTYRHQIPPRHKARPKCTMEDPNGGYHCGSEIKTRTCVICRQPRCEVHRRCYHFAMAQGPVELQSEMRIHRKDRRPLIWWLPTIAPDENLVMEVHNNRQYRWHRQPNSTKWFLRCRSSEKEPRNSMSWTECLNHPEKWLAMIILWRACDLETLFQDFSAMRTCINRFWKTKHTTFFAAWVNALLQTELPAVLLVITVGYLPSLAVPARFRQKTLKVRAREIIRSNMRDRNYRQSAFPSTPAEDRTSREIELKNLLPHHGAEKLTTFIAHESYFYPPRFRPAFEQGGEIRNVRCDKKCKLCKRRGHTSEFCTAPGCWFR